MAHPMTQDEWHAFASAGTRTGKLATTRRDGRPHVTPVWFVLDGDDIVFTTSEMSVKGRSLLRSGQASLSVDDQEPPFSFVSVEGTATVSHDRDELLTFATRIAGRYMGADRAEDFGRRNAVPEEMLVRLTPTKVVAIADLTG